MHGTDNTLQNPIESFVQLVENVEVLFVKVFDVFKHMTNVLSRLHGNKLETYEGRLKCDKDYCNLKFPDSVLWPSFISE